MSILGVDVSHYQGVMDWDKAKANGVQFAIIKVGEGTSWIDPQFDRNVAECRRLGIVWGAYFYWYPQFSPTLQAEHFINLLMGHAPEIGIWGDFEQKSTLVNASDKSSRAKIFMDYIDDFYSAGIYTSPYYWKDDIGSPDWSLKYPLWIANYFVDAPKIPQPWTSSMIWQDGSSAIGANYGAKSVTIDTDVWMKLASDFDALRGTEVIPEPIPEPEPTPEPVPGQTFADVPPTHWAFEAIEKLYKEGIASGSVVNGQLLFSPNNPVTRAQLAVMLVNAMGITPLDKARLDHLWADHAAKYPPTQTPA